MDPALIIFGLGIGVLVGMTGMGGASLMTPLLILIFGVQPVTAIGTDIFYAAVTKTVGGWQQLRHRTVHRGLAFWMALGSVPAAIAGVAVIEALQHSVGEDRLDGIVFGMLGATLLVVGISTMIRTILLPDVIEEREAMHLYRRHIIAAVATGLTTGFVIGLTSAGSGTLIAIILIAVFRLTPQRVVGTDIFHAAVLLWAAGAAHMRRRQRRLQPRRQHPDRLGPRRPARRPPGAEERQDLPPGGAGRRPRGVRRHADHQG